MSVTFRMHYVVAEIRKQTWHKQNRLVEVIVSYARYEVAVLMMNSSMIMEDERLVMMVNHVVESLLIYLMVMLMTLVIEMVTLQHRQSLVYYVVMHILPMVILL
jgi:hypothetical protein